MEERKKKETNKVLYDIVQTQTRKDKKIQTEETQSQTKLSQCGTGFNRTATTIDDCINLRDSLT